MPAPVAARDREADVAVVGAGAAGLYAALCAAREKASVALVSATPLAETASYWAQGGLAAAIGDDDSEELHLADTERAGRGGRCAGVGGEGGTVVVGRAVVMATGGAAALWSRTTNPPGSQGIGLLLAQAAGAALADLELVQFHPTAVIGVRGREGFLITEAIRGEGATLHDETGERFVDELAPRDEVARAIQARMEASGATSV